MGTQYSTRLNESGKAEFRRGDRAIGVECSHVYNEGRLGAALALYKDLGIGQARVYGHKAGCQEGIEHGLHEGTVGWLVGWGECIRQKQPTRGAGQPDVRGI